MKTVAVSQRIDFLEERDETRDALDQNLCRFLLSASLLPVPVPNSIGTGIESWLEKIAPEFIVLSGGNDIGEFPERDSTEKALLLHAETNKLPLLGICRGMQMLASEYGSKVVEVSGHVATRHKVSGNQGIEVNSFHNCAIENEPSEFEVSARAEDGVIEAIRHKTLPWLGLMWHPEREKEFREEDLNAIKALFA